MPEIKPIEQPQTLFQRIAFWVTRRQYGKVITPLKVIYARKPRFALIGQMIARTMDHGLSIDPDLRLLVQVHVAQLNGCPFCEDLNLARAMQEKIGLERFQALPMYRTSNLFSARERVALGFVEEATTYKQIDPALFVTLKAHFSELEIIELTWLNAAENYFNLQSAILGIGSDQLADVEG